MTHFDLSITFFFLYLRVCSVSYVILSFEFSFIAHDYPLPDFSFFIFLVLGYVNADAEVANVWTFQIIRRANELGEDPLSLSNRFCQEYLNDMGDLQCLVPTHQPRVSEHLEQIKDMITQVSASLFHFLFYFEILFPVLFDSLFFPFCLLFLETENPVQV